MFKRNFCPALLLALLCPVASLALGLGDIHLKSSLNAPLDAEIDLVGASAEDLADLKASLAERDTFTRRRSISKSCTRNAAISPHRNPV